MLEIITQYWLVFTIAVIIGLITAWWMWGGNIAEERYRLRDEKREQKALEEAQADTSTAVPAPKIVPEPEDGARDELVIERQPAAKANPIAAMPAAAVVAAPEPTEKSKPNIAAAVGEPDNLRQIKGVGPKLNTLLGTLGVTRFDQIATWGETEIAEVDGYLGSFKGRITRDNWVDQAEFLAKGDIAGFEAKYGKI